MSIWVKAGLATLGIGAIGGVGAYAGGLFESKKEQTAKDTSTKQVINVSSKLKDEGFEALDTTANNGWQDVLTEYTKPTKKKFPAGITITSIQHLQAECGRLKNENSEVTDSYSLAKQWCVKKQKISEILKNGKKFKVLVDSESNQWTTKINNLKNQEDTVKALGITKSIGQTLVNDDLVQKCKTIGDLETTNDDFLTKFELAKDWCSVPQKN